MLLVLLKMSFWFSFYLTGADNHYHLTNNLYDHFIMLSEIRVFGAHVKKIHFL